MLELVHVLLELLDGSNVLELDRLDSELENLLGTELIKELGKMLRLELILLWLSGSELDMVTNCQLLVSDKVAVAELLGISDSGCRLSVLLGTLVLPWEAAADSGSAGEDTIASSTLLTVRSHRSEPFRAGLSCGGGVKCGSSAGKRDRNSWGRRWHRVKLESCGRGFLSAELNLRFCRNRGCLKRLYYLQDGTINQVCAGFCTQPQR